MTIEMFVDGADTTPPPETMKYVERAREDLRSVAREIPKRAALVEVRKRLLELFPYGKRTHAGKPLPMYTAWRSAIAFHIRERTKLTAWEAACRSGGVE